MCNVCHNRNYALTLCVIHMLQPLLCFFGLNLTFILLFFDIMYYCMNLAKFSCLLPSTIEVEFLSIQSANWLYRLCFQ